VNEKKETGTRPFPRNERRKSSSELDERKKKKKNERNKGLSHDKTRQDKTRQGKARQDKTRQDKTRQDKISRLAFLNIILHCLCIVMPLVSWCFVPSWVLYRLVLPCALRLVMSYLGLAVC
jgi:Flp pilus assembly protein TadB